MLQDDVIPSAQSCGFWTRLSICAGIRLLCLFPRSMYKSKLATIAAAGGTSKYCALQRRLDRTTSLFFWDTQPVCAPFVTLAIDYPVVLCPASDSLVAFPLNKELAAGTDVIARGSITSPSRAHFPRAKYTPECFYITANPKHTHF